MYDHQFTDKSTSAPSHPITSYFWDFGDGFSSTKQNPCHTFSTSGTYTISLTVTNDCGSSTSSQLIPIGGDNNMETYPIEVVDGSKITIHIPVIEPILTIEILNIHTNNPVPNTIVQLETTNGTILQTHTTDASGIVAFINITHGNYIIRV